MATKGREKAGHKGAGRERDEERVERDEEGWVEGWRGVGSWVEGWRGIDS